VSLNPTYPQTRATKPSRLSEVVSYDAATVHEILDGAVVCHVGFVAGERPQVLPMLFVRTFVPRTALQTDDRNSINPAQVGCRSFWARRANAKWDRVSGA